MEFGSGQRILQVWLGWECSRQIVELRKQVLCSTVVTAVGYPDQVANQPPPSGACVVRRARQITQRIDSWVTWEVGCRSKNEVAEIIGL